MSLLMLIIYVIVLIYLIIKFYKCLKKQAKWNILFIVELILIFISWILMMYYDNLPGEGFMPGLSYLGEYLVNFGALIIYSIVLFITIFTKLILYLLEKKKKGKNYFPKIFMTLSLILFILGSYSLIIDLKNDINIVKTTGTIIGYDNEEQPIVEYTVNNKKYKDVIIVMTDEIENSKINDNIEITYNKNKPSELAYTHTYEVIYVPCYILAVLLFILVKKKKR